MPRKSPPHLDLAAREARARQVHGKRLPARDADAQALFARGFPNLVVVGDEKAKNAAGDAKKRLQAIDPTFAPRWPREVAVRWLHAFARDVHPFNDAAALAAALGRTDAPDAALLRELLERALESTSGYAFKHADAMYLFEALLGADEVVATWVDVLRRAPKSAWLQKNPNVRSVTHATALGWVLLRASEKSRQDALSGLAKARATVGDGGRATLARAVDFVLGDALPDLESESERRLRVVHLSDELATARARHPWRLWIADPQDCWVTGVTPPTWAVARLPAEPRWLAQHLADRWGLLATPFSEELERTKKALPKRLTKKALDVEVHALFERLVADVKKARGDARGEERLMRDASLGLVMLRARSGDPTPDFHIGHILGVDGWDKKNPAPLQRLEATDAELDRWMRAINAAIE